LKAEKPSRYSALRVRESDFYDMSPDGQRILAVAAPGNQKNEALSVALNCAAALKK